LSPIAIAAGPGAALLAWKPGKHPADGRHDVSEIDQAQVTWLTQEAYDRLSAELERLTTHGRAELSEKIGVARAEGDLRENAGYHAAKEEQGQQEARIRQLTTLLRNAKVGEAPPADGVAEPGMLVTVRFDDGDEERFLLGSREEAAHADVTVYSAQSPLGQAITGRKSGEQVSYQLPNGAPMTVEILDAVPYTG
jgi:transcription elongation factor GreA